MRPLHTAPLFASLLATILPSAIARAQSSPAAPTPTPAPPAALAPLPPIVVPTRADPPGATPADAIGLPLRLSMLSSIPSGSPAGGCSQPSVDGANTILPVQPSVRVQLTLRLTLELVSNLGCPGDPYAAFDTGIGGGLTYAAGLRPNLWLVAGAGTYGTSHRGTSAVSGLDLVTKTASGDSRSVGVGASTKGPGTRVMARVGGSF
jgi:hypothetical protein